MLLKNDLFTFFAVEVLIEDMDDFAVEAAETAETAAAEAAEATDPVLLAIVSVALYMAGIGLGPLVTEIEGLYDPNRLAFFQKKVVLSDSVPLSIRNRKDNKYTLTYCRI